MPKSKKNKGPVLAVVHVKTESCDDYYLKLYEPWPETEEEQLEVIRRTGEIGDDAAFGGDGPGIAGSWLHIENVTVL